MDALKRRERLGLEEPRIQEMGYRESPLGRVQYIRIFTPSYQQLSYTEIWECFNRSYSGLWAVMMFPPEYALVDDQNIYHLFVTGCQDSQVRGLDIRKG